MDPFEVERCHACNGSYQNLQIEIEIERGFVEGKKP